MYRVYGFEEAVQCSQSVRFYPYITYDKKKKKRSNAHKSDLNKCLQFIFCFWIEIISIDNLQVHSVKRGGRREFMYERVEGIFSIFSNLLGVGTISAVVISGGTSIVLSGTVLVNHLEKLKRARLKVINLGLEVFRVDVSFTSLCL